MFELYNYVKMEIIIEPERTITRSNSVVELAESGRYVNREYPSSIKITK